MTAPTDPAPTDPASAKPGRIEAAKSFARLEKRPHYRLDGESLVFMRSRRPARGLDHDEQMLWRRIELAEGTLAWEDLTEPAARAAAGRLVADQFCDPIELFAPDRPEILIFEPHCDDAALSIGGTLWRDRHKFTFTIVTLGGRSNFTSYYYSDQDHFGVDEISALRRAEGKTYAERIGGRSIMLDLDEAPLRYHNADWTREWYDRHRASVSAFNNHRVGDDERRRWRTAMADVLERSDAHTLWVPLGIGMHSDHEMTRDVICELMAERSALFAGRDVRFYADIPYAHEFPAHGQAVLDRLEQSGAILAATPESVTDTLDEKIALLGIFASQFKVRAIEAGVRASARSQELSGNGAAIEQFWRLTQLPDRWVPGALFAEYDALRDDRRSYRRWWQSWPSAHSLSILLLNAPGRLVDDIVWLRARNRHASVTLYVTSATEAEVADARQAGLLPDVTIAMLGTRPVDWLRLSLKLMLSRPDMVMFAAGRRLATAKKLARLWIGSRVLVAASLDHMIRGLDYFGADEPAFSVHPGGSSNGASQR